jgi:hypothetical protein
LRARKTR